MLKRRLFRRPGLLAALITALVYYDPVALHGDFVYDDKGSIQSNPVVKGEVNAWTELWTRDFWGTLLASPSSHKSYRPITTLTLKWNWMYAADKKKNNDDDDDLPPAWSFRVTNVALHALCVWLVTEASGLVFSSGGEDFIIYIAALITGLLFGLHPVHAEAVSNVTNRGEMLMSIFFLLALLVYGTNPRGGMQIVIPCCILMVLSTLSKEPGITTLLSLFLYNLIDSFGSVQGWIQSLLQGSDDSNSTTKREALQFLKQSTVFAVVTLGMGLVRLYMNGDTRPYFLYEQNPAAFHEDFFTRLFSINWVCCLYLYDVIYPRYLSPDWSGESIPLITSCWDWRILVVLGLWLVVALVLKELVVAPNKFASKRYLEARRIALVAIIASTFSPFLLSSNLIVKTGLMKADRVMYLPLFGLCMLEALAFRMVLLCPQQNDHELDDEDVAKSSKKKQQADSGDTKSSPIKNAERGRTGESEKRNSKLPASPQKETIQEPEQDTPDVETTPKQKKSSPLSSYLFGMHWLGHILLMTQLGLFALKVRERHMAWSSSFRLWQSAFEVNPRSHHTRYQYANDLKTKGRIQQAEWVFRPIREPTAYNPNTTFEYCDLIMDAGRCDYALPLLERALEVVRKESESTSQYKLSPASQKRVKSNLLAVKGRCTKDRDERFAILQQAMDVDPGNDYARWSWTMRMFAK